MELVRSHWGVENVLHRTLDVKFREDDYCLRRGSAPAVQGILRWTVLNMVRTLQQNFRPDLSIGLLRNKIGHNPALLAPDLGLTATFRVALPEDRRLWCQSLTASEYTIATCTGHKFALLQST